MSDLWSKLLNTPARQALAGAVLFLVGVGTGLSFKTPLDSFISQNRFFDRVSDERLDQCPVNTLAPDAGFCIAARELAAVSDPDIRNSVYFNRARLYMGMRRNDLALRDIDTALAIPKVAPSARAKDWIFRGSLLVMTNEMRTAKASYTTALPLSSRIDRLNAKLGRANAEIHLGEFDPALADLNDVIAESPEAIAAYRTLTVRSLAQSSAQERKSWLARKDAGFAASAAGVLFVRAIVYRNLGQYEKSLADSDAAIRLAPGYPVLYSGRARTEFAMGRWQAGFSDLWTRTKLVFGWR